VCRFGDWLAGLGGTVQYGNDHIQCQGVLLLKHVDEYVVSTRCMSGNMLAAWRQVLPLAIEHVLRDMPHAMMLLVRAFVLPRALYACIVWGPYMLLLSPCGQSCSQSELLSICKHFLGLRGSLAQASLLDELGLQPLQIVWLKACV
jgi:hypothetical protein